MIGGNITAVYQRQNGTTTNAIGEKMPEWEDIRQMTGWLDLVSGDSKYGYNAKLQESTHIFLCDYVAIDRKTDDKRLVVNDTPYDVLLVDDPMEMHQQLELYLRCVG